MASTGSSLDAENAGMIPEINPIRAETPIPRNTFPGVMIRWKLVLRETMTDRIITISNPTIPPINERKMASNKNWNRIK